MKPSSLFSSFTLGAAVAAQSFVPPPRNVETLLSERFPGASITYKQVNNLCETTEGVGSYSGYVHLPREFIPDASEWPKGSSGNYFFWYFEARNDPENAPTAIYLGGGPGYTSFDGSSVFPCYVNRDSNSTILNKNSWNNNVNMLYIDQPIGVGFSYTALQNGTYDLLDGTVTPIESEKDLPELSLTLLQGTVEHGGPVASSNSTKSAARTFWRFAQVWFNEFPRITQNDEISIWAVSYGGLYAPIFTSHFIDQNALILNEEHELTNATVLNMATVGLINGMVDIESFALGFPDWSMNNTYGLPAYGADMYQEVMTNLTYPEMGCLDLVRKCRAAVAQYDPDSYGLVPEVNEVCVGATAVCGGAIKAYEISGYYHFDITLNDPAVLPTEYETALFNQPWVQAELGVPRNFTRYHPGIEDAFLAQMGDMARYDLSYLGHVLDNGVNVAMVYGDRDYRCNWFSAENASLHIPFVNSDQFSSAGYEPLTTNSSYQGGFVREVSGLSFSRVFQAGHSAGGYQPETVAAIFNRAMFGRDVATGKVDLATTPEYHSEGAMSVRDVKNELPDLVENICYQLAPHVTCTEEQMKALGDGSAETENFVVVKPAGVKGTRLGGGGQGDGGNDNGNGNGNGSGDGNGDGGSGSVRVAASLLVALVPMLVSVLI